MTARTRQADTDSPTSGARLLAAAAVLGAVAVGFGAFGAHALSDRFGPDETAWWETATLYLLVHAVAGAVAGLLAHLGAGRGAWASRLLLGGATVFAGTLYAMALGAPRWLGAVTPLGGTCMIAGWLALAASAWRAGAGERGEVPR
jgi:uncharacterized membrane protein YgdD (TMEM256/DUF423 family)